MSIPDGAWVSRTQVATLLTFWPPLPPEVMNVSVISFSTIEKVAILLRNAVVFEAPTPKSIMELKVLEDVRYVTDIMAHRFNLIRKYLRSKRAILSPNLGGCV